MAIPRILHQNYFQGWDKLPDATKESIEALRARNPGWEYRFYDAASAEAYISKRFGSGVLKLFRSIDPSYYAARSDFFRYLVCYESGGVYLDIKSNALKPLDEVLHQNDEFLISQWSSEPDLASAVFGKSLELSHVQGGEYVQWFIAAAPGHPFLSAVIDRVSSNIESYRFWRNERGKHGVWLTTGPIAYTLAINPIIDRFPSRYVCFLRDLSFVYTIHGSDVEHHQSYGRSHYSELTDPIVSRNGLEATVGRHFTPWMRWKIDGVMKRIWRVERS